MKNNKEYLSINEQLNHLENKKNIKINIDRQKAYNLLKSESYGRLVTPYKDLLVVYNLDNTKQLEPWTKNRRILREYQQGLRVPIASKGRIKIKDILNPLNNYRTAHKEYTKEHKFGQLIHYKNINNKIVKILRKPIEDIELIIKSTVSEFVGVECMGLKWYDYLLSISTRPFQIIKLLNNFWDRFNKTEDVWIKDENPERYKKSTLHIWQALNEMTLGEVKEIIICIRYSKLNNKEKRKFFKTLFYDNLELDLKLKKIDFNDLMWRLDVFVNLRNATSHAEKLNKFILKERFKTLKSYMNDSEYRVWFLINDSKDKTIKEFLKNYNKIGNSDLSTISSNFIFNNLNLGYFLEIENLKNLNVISLDLKIFEVINWWFEKRTKTLTN